MSILSGFKKFKDYILTENGYQLSSRWTKSDAVVMGDGTDDTNTLEKNCGAIKGITDSLTANNSNIAASSAAVATLNESLNRFLTGTLTAGATSLTISDSSITTDSMIDIYANVFGVNPTEVTVANGSITLVFDAQESDLGVKVRVM